MINYFTALVIFILLPKISYFFRKYPCIWNKNNHLTWLQNLIYIGITDFIKYWNDYEIHGLDEVLLSHKRSNTLLVGYHSRCTLDLLYVFCIIQPNLLVSYLLFNLPVLKSIFPSFNIISSKSKKNDETELKFISTLVNSNRPLLLLPGGIHECLKPYNQRYQLQWKKIPGYIRVIYEAKDYLGDNTRVIPFYTRNCEKCFYNHEYIYEIFGNYGNKCYQSFKNGNILILPFMLTIIIISLGFIILPSNIKLDTYFGNPIILNKNETAEDFAMRVQNATQELINKVEKSDIIKNKLNSNNIIKTILNYGIFLILGIYTIIQNSLITTILLILVWLPLPFLLLYCIFDYIYHIINYFIHL